MPSKKLEASGMSRGLRDDLNTRNSKAQDKGESFMWSLGPLMKALMAPAKWKS